MKGNSVEDEDSSRNDTSPQEQEEPEDHIDVDIARVRAILNANVGACHVKMVKDNILWTFCLLTFNEGDHPEAVKACSQGKRIGTSHANHPFLMR